MPKRDALLWARALVRTVAPLPRKEWSTQIRSTLKAMELAGDAPWIRRLSAVLPEAIRREGAPAITVRVAPQTDTPAWREELARVLRTTVDELAWTTDASLLSGARITAPGWTIDASLAGRLNALRITLSA